MRSGFIKRNTAIEGGLAYFFAVAAYLLIVVIFTVIFNYVNGGIGHTLLQFFEGVLISVSFAAVSIISNVSLKSKPIYKFDRTEKSAFVICPAVAIISLLGFQGLAFFFFQWLMALGFHQGGMLDFNDPLALTLTSLRVILLAPICEEMLMRSSVLSSLVSLTDRKRPKYRLIRVVALNGALFALIHMNPLQTVYQFFFGCALAYITIKYRSILPAIAIHMFNNAFAVVLSIPVIDEWLSGLVASAFTSAGGIIIFAVCAVLAAALALFLIFFLVKLIVPNKLPETVSESNHNSGFRTEMDDNGALVATFIYIVSCIIALSIWTAVLVGGFTA